MLRLNEGLIVITGARGIGKTTAAATFLPPSQIKRCFYHDGENSANRVRSDLQASGLDFGYYNNLDSRWAKVGINESDLLNRIAKGNLPWATTKERNSLVDFWYYIIQDIETHLKPGEFWLYVHDPVERLEAAMAAWVEDNQASAGWRSLGYGGMWNQGFYPLYRQLMQAIYARGVQTIIFTAHLGNQWEGQGREAHIVPGKVKVRAKPELIKLAQLYVWLVEERANADGAPAGIILKERLGKLRPNPNTDSWEPTTGLPHRIPHFTWADVERYIEQGVDLAHPAPGETLSQQEAEMIDDTFYSSEQMRLMLAWAQKELADVAVANPSLLSTDGNIKVDVSEGGLVRQLAEAGLSAEQIAAQLGKPLPLVQRLLAAA